jgi:hypothetical protein
MRPKPQATAQPNAKIAGEIRVSLSCKTRFRLRGARTGFIAQRAFRVWLVAVRVEVSVLAADVDPAVGHRRRRECGTAGASGPERRTGRRGARELGDSRRVKGEETPGIGLATYRLVRYAVRALPQTLRRAQRAESRVHDVEVAASTDSQPELNLDQPPRIPTYLEHGVGCWSLVQLLRYQEAAQYDCDREEDRDRTLSRPMGYTQVRRAPWMSAASSAQGPPPRL